MSEVSRCFHKSGLPETDALAETMAEVQGLADNADNAQQINIKRRLRNEAIIFKALINIYDYRL